MKEKEIYLYIVQDGQFSFEVEIDKILGKVGDWVYISYEGNEYEVKITKIEDHDIYCSQEIGD
ncbi:hypothetical protein [Bacteroides fragilis]|uniref:hypothetical protein n=1 Tax=Bacteroides fragilis TaxID=817 RepID=UPI00028246F8|nr:hypothetical protein [Bacteroides fragilis]EKA82481.1 hypothetical protein HMPREF1205_02852 [Bacteroides fragilis HMW 616]